MQETYCEREMDKGANPGRVRSSRDARFSCRRSPGGGGARRGPGAGAASRRGAGGRRGRLVSFVRSDYVAGNFTSRKKERTRQGICGGLGGVGRVCCREYVRFTMSYGELNINFVVPKTLLGCTFPVRHSEYNYF